MGSMGLEGNTVNNTTLKEWLDNSIDIIEAGVKTTLVQLGILTDGPKATMDLAEIVNEVWIHLATRLDRFKGTNFAGWVYTCARRLAYRFVARVQGYRQVHNGTWRKREFAFADFESSPLQEDVA